MCIQITIDSMFFANVIVASLKCQYGALVQKWLKYKYQKALLMNPSATCKLRLSQGRKGGKSCYVLVFLGSCMASLIR
jgi:hypothetical protein